MSIKVTLKSTLKPTPVPMLMHGDLIEITYNDGGKRYGLVHGRQFVAGMSPVYPLPLHVMYLDGGSWDKLESITGNPEYAKVRKLERGEALTLEAA